MGQFVISIDSTACVTAEEMKTNDFVMVYLSYTLDGIDHIDKFENDEQRQFFYNQIEQGHLAQSSKANPESFRSAWEPILAQGRDILHLSLSSKVSGSYESACQAADELSEKYEARIRIVDTRTGCFSITALAHDVAAKRADITLDEAYDYAVRLSEEYNLIFTVGDIKYLRRGGRISHVKALLGGLLHLKPILFVNNEGKLTFLMNARGMRQALSLMVSKMLKNATAFTQSAYIAHGGDVSLGLALKNKLMEAFPKLKEIRIDFLTPVLGLHAGPGSLVLCFRGADRNGVLDENPIKEILEKVLPKHD